jgi:uncharacterized protein
MSRVQSLRDELGGVHPLAEKKVKDHLEPYVKAFIENAPFAVMASSDADGNCDASPKGGYPGFVKVLDDKTLFIPDIGGNRLFQSYGNFESNPKAGLVFMIPGFEVTARVNGRVTIVENQMLEALEAKAEVSNPDDNATVVQGIKLDIDEAYFHCPRSMRFSEVWNTDTISRNASMSLKDLKP